jgi:hypothetical protein
MDRSPVVERATLESRSRGTTSSSGPTLSAGGKSVDAGSVERRRGVDRTPPADLRRTPADLGGVKATGTKTTGSGVGSTVLERPKSTGGASERVNPADLRNRIREPGAMKKGDSGDSSLTGKGRSTGSADSTTIKKLDGDQGPRGDRPSTAEIRKILGNQGKTTEVRKDKTNAVDLNKGLKKPDATDLPKVTKPGTPGRMGTPGELRKDALEKGDFRKRDGVLPTDKGRRLDPSATGRGIPGPDGGKPPIGKRFPDRFEKGDLDQITKSNIGKKLDLNDQYKFMKQGDVARRMDIVNKVKKTDIHVNVTHVNNINVAGRANIFAPHPYHVVHGWVGPAYQKSCFHYSYWGPSYYASLCWYPHWGPWLNWSWHYHCHPIWDPRPIWCQPVVYVAAPAWVYYDVPAWEPLPVVASGTWVDVPKVVVPETQYDLQLLAVRFVDPGHPDEKLGPRYRVWFRNNAVQPVQKPFNVTVLFTPDGQIAANPIQAGVRVTAIEAGDTQSVDVRLPFDVTKLAKREEGKPAVGTLHVLVDANREINDVETKNNGSKLAVADILPVDPAAFDVDPKSVVAGKEVVLAGEGLGPEPGKVLVQIGGLQMEAEILGWYDLGVRINVPKIPLSNEATAELIVVRGDGAATNPVQVKVTPPGLDAAE